MIGIPFVASEDAETVDELFQGTEEEVERTWPQHQRCTISLMTFSTCEKLAAGRKRSDGVQVSFRDVNSS